MSSTAARHSVRLTLSLCGVALAMILWRLVHHLPPRLWFAAALHPAPDDIAELVFHFSTLPRIVTAALCGGALAVAGAMVQQVLGNPLASPVTLGVSSGAELALVAATLFAPAALDVGADLIPLAGGLASMGLVLAVASAQGVSSLALILSGLSIAIICGALGGLLALFNQEALGAVFVWGSGSLDQQDWSVVARLLPRLCLLGLGAALLVRPLHLLGLSGESARSLGLSLALFRAATLGIAVGLATTVTAAVGTLGFVEIAAPLLARLAGARTPGHRLLASAAIGAALLLVVDTLVEALDAEFGTALPTGAATAFLSAPLLLWLLPQLRPDAAAATRDPSGPQRRRPPGPVLVWLTLVCVGALMVAAVVGRSSLGWSLLSAETWHRLASWRVPRVAQAFAGGALAAMAGTLLQKTTRNPMASPEILGLGAASVTGLALALVLDPNPSPLGLFGSGTAGASALLSYLLWRGLRSGFAPDQMLLTGVALSAALNAVLAALLAANDGRAAILLGWLSGSTAHADCVSATLLIGLAGLCAPLALAFGRSLDLMGLGEPLSRALGLAPVSSRAGVMLLAAAMTAGAVVAIGPLTFVGLLGPHLAARLGLRRSTVQLPGAALLGGSIMVASDWLGRVALTPFELPAGLVAALIGAPYLLACLLRPARRSG